MLQVPLKPGLPDGQWACLRSLCGHDEVGMNGTGLLEATRFIDRLLVKMPGTTVEPGKVTELAICDCDRLFAAVYRTYFGEDIESQVTCLSCNEGFELNFSLADLIRRLQEQSATKATGPDAKGLYQLPDGRRFRLPTVGDRYHILGMEPEAALGTLLERCVVEGDPTQSPAEIQGEMEKVGGVLDLDLNATCPYCGNLQLVQFDIQNYVLGSFLFEKRFLYQEIHHIAMAYGWGYQEILNLSREQRRRFVRLIGADAAAPQRRRV